MNHFVGFGSCAARAAKPQRGRLREFLQWNADVLGDASPAADEDILGLLEDFFDACGLSPESCRVHLNDRSVVEDAIRSAGVTAESTNGAFALLDKRAKLAPNVFHAEANAIGLDVDVFDRASAEGLSSIAGLLQSPWRVASPSVVRGLAYYTGTVFEVIAEGERAVAGGGRYDGLVELFGGPSTPAVGFGMGDVVLTNLLQDKGLMPTDRELLEEIGARPDVFVIAPNDDLVAEAAALVAALRRQGVHARRSAKATRNVGKLLKEASGVHARHAAILESPGVCTLKDLDHNEDTPDLPTTALPERCRPSPD